VVVVVVRFEVVVAMMCGRGGVSVCVGVRGAVSMWFGWGVADLVLKRLADGSFLRGVVGVGWLGGGWLLWWLLWEIPCEGRLCFLDPNSLSLTLVYVL